MLPRISLHEAALESLEHNRHTLLDSVHSFLCSKELSSRDKQFLHDFASQFPAAAVVFSFLRRDAAFIDSLDHSIVDHQLMDAFTRFSSDCRFIELLQSHSPLSNVNQIWKMRERGMSWYEIRNSLNLSLLDNTERFVDKLVLDYRYDLICSACEEVLQHIQASGDSLLLRKLYIICKTVQIGDDLLPVMITLLQSIRASLPDAKDMVQMTAELLFFSQFLLNVHPTSAFLSEYVAFLKTIARLLPLFEEVLGQIHLPTVLLRPDVSTAYLLIVLAVRYRSSLCRSPGRILGAEIQHTPVDLEEGAYSQAAASDALSSIVFSPMRSDFAKFQCICLDDSPGLELSRFICGVGDVRFFPEQSVISFVDWAANILPDALRFSGRLQSTQDFGPIFAASISASLLPHLSDISQCGSVWDAIRRDLQSLRILTLSLLAKSLLVCSYEVVEEASRNLGSSVIAALFPFLDFSSISSERLLVLTQHCNQDAFIQEIRLFLNDMISLQKLMGGAVSLTSTPAPLHARRKEMYNLLFLQWLSSGVDPYVAISRAIESDLEYLLPAKFLTLAIEEKDKKDHQKLFWSLMQLDDHECRSNHIMMHLNKLRTEDVVLLLQLSDACYDDFRALVSDLQFSGFLQPGGSLSPKILSDPYFFAVPRKMKDSCPTIDNDVLHICASMVTRKPGETFLPDLQFAYGPVSSRTFTPYGRFVRPRASSVNKGEVARDDKVILQYLFSLFQMADTPLNVCLSRDECISFIQFLLDMSDVPTYISAWMSSRLQSLCRNAIFKFDELFDESARAKLSSDSSSLAVAFRFCCSQSWCGIALLFANMCLERIQSADDISLSVCEMLLHFPSSTLVDAFESMWSVTMPFARALLSRLCRKIFPLAVVDKDSLSKTFIQRTGLHKVYSLEAYLTAFNVLCFWKVEQTWSLIQELMSAVCLEIFEKSYQDPVPADTLGKVFSFFLDIFRVEGSLRHILPWNRTSRVLEVLNEILLIEPSLPARYIRLIINDDSKQLLLLKDDLTSRGHFAYAELLCQYFGIDPASVISASRSAHSRLSMAAAIEATPKNLLNRSVPLLNKNNLDCAVESVIWATSDDLCGKGWDELLTACKSRKAPNGPLFPVAAVEVLVSQGHADVLLDFLEDWTLLTICAFRTNQIPTMYALLNDRFKTFEVGITNRIRDQVAKPLRDLGAFRMASSFHALVGENEVALSCCLDGYMSCETLLEQLELLPRVRKYGGDALMCDVETSLLKKLLDMSEAGTTISELPAFKTDPNLMRSPYAGVESRKNGMVGFRTTLFGSLYEQCRVAETLLMIGEYGTAVRVMNALRLPADVYRKCAVTFIHQNQPAKLLELITEMKGLVDVDDWDGVLTACVHTLVLELQEYKLAERLCGQVKDPSRKVLCCLICEKHKAACFLAIENGRIEDVLMVREQSDAKGLKSVVQMCDKYLAKHGGLR
eukprot:ANDGO_00031.mRNA.1 hypothetical protein